MSCHSSAGAGDVSWAAQDDVRPKKRVRVSVVQVLPPLVVLVPDPSVFRHVVQQLTGLHSPGQDSCTTSAAASADSPTSQQQSCAESNSMAESGAVTARRLGGDCGQSTTERPSDYTTLFLPAALKKPRFRTPAISTPSSSSPATCCSYDANSPVSATEDNEPANAFLSNASSQTSFNVMPRRPVSNASSQTSFNVDSEITRWEIEPLHRRPESASPNYTTGNWENEPDLLQLDDPFHELLHELLEFPLHPEHPSSL